MHFLLTDGAGKAGDGRLDGQGDMWVERRAAASTLAQAPFHTISDALWRFLCSRIGVL